LAVVIGRGSSRSRSAAGHGTDDQQRLAPLDDGRWQQRIEALVGYVLLAGEQPSCISA